MRRILRALVVVAGLSFVCAASSLSAQTVLDCETFWDTSGCLAGSQRTCIDDFAEMYDCTCLRYGSGRGQTVWACTGV